VEDFIQLIIFLAIIWSVVGGMFKKAPPAQPQGRPAPGEAAPRPEARPRQVPLEPAESSAQAAGAGEEKEEIAAGMIPDDLWEILTGERRAPAPVSRPGGGGWASEVPDTWVSAEPEIYPDEEEDLAPIVEARDLASYDDRAVIREPIRRETPILVSLEGAMPRAGIRHAEFRKRLEAGTPVRPAARPRGLRGNTAALRRAIVLREVLGPPRGLE